MLLKALGYTAAPLVLFSAFGYALDRLGTVEPRHLVPFAAYGGYVSILGYPIGTDIGAPWLAVHVVVPLSIPAAVGLAAVIRWGNESLSTDDVTGAAIAAPSSCSLLHSSSTRPQRGSTPTSTGGEPAGPVRPATGVAPDGPGGDGPNRDGQRRRHRCRHVSRRARRRLRRR